MLSGEQHTGKFQVTHKLHGRYIEAGRIILTSDLRNIWSGLIGLHTTASWFLYKHIIAELSLQVHSFVPKHHSKQKSYDA